MPGEEAAVARVGKCSGGGVCWQIGEGCADIFDQRFPDECLADGTARVVKSGPHRTVYRLSIGGLDVHLKHYHPAGGGALRDLLPSPARREYRRTLAVARRGVATLQPLAFGETRRGHGPRSSYLLTRTLPDARPLDQVLETTLPALPSRQQARLRQRLSAALGRFLARLHQTGVAHRDLHPGNLLLRLVDDEPKFFLIDLNTVRLGAPLSGPVGRANLVILNRWFMLRASRTDRLRCWRAYEQARPGARHNSRDYPRDLERRTLASNARFWLQQDARCVGTNRYFRRLRRGQVAGHAVADLSAAALAPLLADPDAPFARPGVRVLKHSPTSSVVEFDFPGPAGPRRVIYKRFAVARWSDPWAALVRPTPALRSFVLGHGLRVRGLPTPRPLAVWHRVPHGLRREGYLLTEKVPDALDLLAYVTRLGRQPPAERRAALRRLIDQVAKLIRLMHARRLSHRDLKAPNLLVSPERWAVAAKGVKELGAAADATEDGPQVWFIDLVGVRRHAKLGRRRRLQNLARLSASFLDHPALTRTDKLRFLRVYLNWGLHGRLGWKRWWRQVAGATRAKVRRNLRNGRPLG
jgi:tRNA A-37 threonylcarbamoyl transferase component Bud32